MQLLFVAAISYRSDLSAARRENILGATEPIGIGTRSMIGSIPLRARANQSGQNIGTRPIHWREVITPPSLATTGSALRLRTIFPGA